MNTRSDHTPDGEVAHSPPGLEAEGGGIVDFAPQHLPADAAVDDGVRLLVERNVWGMPLVDGSGDYVGMLTARSLVAAALPVALDAVPRRGLLRRPVR